MGFEMARKVDRRVLRRFTISDRVAEELTTVSEFLGIDQNTLAAMAISHGMQYMDRGYSPKYVKYKNEKDSGESKELKAQIKIFLPEELWIQFNECLTKSKLSGWKLVQIFLEIELSKFLQRIELYEKKLEENGGADESNKRVRVKLDAEISKILYEDMKKQRIHLDIEETQMLKYLLSVGLSETDQLSLEVMRTDKELLDFIHNLNLDTAKALCLVQYILKYKYSRY